MNILVGMSGGVDSSVTALLLKEAGYVVIGATMSIYKGNSVSHPAHKCSHGACYGSDEADDIESARRICKRLGIEYYVFDCADKYNEIVLENFKKEYLSGRTPNPCIWCNSLIKFDLLPKLARLNGVEFDKFATGHYAGIEKRGGRYLLKAGKDPKKDQSYFLYRLKQEQLENIMLPLGDYTKEEIRKIAKNAGLEAADKPDSQDFYEGSYNELLNVKPKIGNIVDLDGNILGQHEGVWNFTRGQRKGLKISAAEPLYVIELRSNKNEVVVGSKDKTMRESLIAEDLNLIAIEKIEDKIVCSAKIRSGQKPVRASITPLGDDKIKVMFEDLQSSIAPGQSVVLYDGDIVLGGGIIKE